MGKGEGAGVDCCRCLPGLTGGRMVELGGPFYLALIVGRIVDKRSASFACATRAGDHRRGVSGVDDLPSRAGSAHNIRGKHLALRAILCHFDRLAPLEPAKERPRGNAEFDRMLAVEPPRAGSSSRMYPSAGIPWLDRKCR